MKKLTWGLVLALPWALAVGCEQTRSAEATGEAAKTQWVTALDDALARAEAKGKPVFVKFYATWCGPCRKMDAETLANAEVRKALERFVPVKIDVDKQEALSDEHGVEYLPTLMVLDAAGKRHAKGEGYMNVQELLGFLATGARKAAE